jgi:tetratricopeptide (TPR) repeat protein
MFYLKKFILIVFICLLNLGQNAKANTSTQDTIPKFDAAKFEASLKELPPIEFAQLFTQLYQKDSIKASISLKHIDDMVQSDDLLAQYWGNFSLAYWEHYQMNLEKSIQYIDRFYEIAVKLDNMELILNALLSKARFYFGYGNYKEAMEFNLQAMELAKKNNLTLRELYIGHNIALIKLQTNDNVGAVELLEKLITVINNDTKDEFIDIRLKLYVASIKGYIGVERYKDAREYCEKAIVLSQKYGDRASEFYVLTFLGDIERLHQNFDKAHQYLDESLVIAQEVKPLAREIPLAYFEKGKIFFDQKNFKEAIIILSKAEALMLENNLDFIKLEEMYALLAKSYNEVGDIKNSVSYYEKANEVYKKNDKRQGSVGVDIVKKYDLKSLEEELNLAETTTKKTKTILFVSIILALLVISGLIYFYKKRERENQQKFKALLKSLEEENEQQKIIATEITTQEIAKEVVVEKAVSKESPPKEVEIIDETKERLIKKLEDFEARKLYLSKNSSLNEVAKKLKTNTSYLSKLVNSHKGKSFTAYITDLRVNYAIRKLK